MRLLPSVVFAVSLAAPLSAKPLVTSSEENFTRICLARAETPERLVAACDNALAAVAVTPSQRVELIVARGDGYLWQQSYEAALASYRMAIALDPNSTQAWNGLGWALWEAEGDLPAFEAFDTSLGISVSVQGLAGKAATGRRLGHFDGSGARELLSAALSIDPDYLWAVREVGWSYIEDGMADRAAEAFREALDIEPADVNARYGLGRTQLMEGNAAEALATFNDVLADAPRDFPTLVYRIIALRNLDRNAQALRASDRLISDFPQKTSGYIERAHALQALGRRGEAIETYAHADRKLGPKNAVLYWYADALAADGRFTDALAVIERGILLAGADYSDHLLKSYIALELGDYDLARASAEASLATGVEDPWAHYYIAIADVHDGDVDAGLARFDQAISIGLPTERVGSFATALVSAGKFVEAAELRMKY